MELNCKISSWYWRIAWWWGTNLHFRIGCIIGSTNHVTKHLPFLYCQIDNSDIQNHIYSDNMILSSCEIDLIDELSLVYLGTYTYYFLYSQIIEDLKLDLIFLADDSIEKA